MQDYHYQFELGQTVVCAIGAVTILGRTKFMCPETYLVVIDGEQVWLLASELSPLPANTTN